MTAIQSNGIIPAVLGASICSGSSGYSSSMINTASLSGVNPVAPTSSTIYPPSLSNENALSGAAIAGIVVGVLVVPALAMLAMCVSMEKKRRKGQGEFFEIEKRSQSLEKERVVTSLVNIAEVAARKKAARERSEQLENGDNQNAEMRGALGT